MAESLSVEDISFSIGGKKILGNVSFTLEKGTVTLLAGRNGSGKSMLLKIIKGLEKESGGKVLIDGVPCTARERMRKTALVFQESMLQIVGQSVEKDISFGLENQKRSREETRAVTEEYLRIFGLEHLRNENPRILSGGERRKVIIAGVLAMGPDILLLDEPLANLDYPSIRTVLKLFESLRDLETTVLVVSHEAEKLLALTDHALVMDGGRLVFDGRSEDSLDALKENGVHIPALPFKELSWL